MSKNNIQTHTTPNTVKTPKTPTSKECVSSLGLPIHPWAPETLQTPPCSHHRPYTTAPPPLPAPSPQESRSACALDSVTRRHEELPAGRRREEKTEVEWSGEETGGQNERRDLVRWEEERRGEITKNNGKREIGRKRRGNVRWGEGRR